MPAISQRGRLARAANRFSRPLVLTLVLCLTLALSAHAASVRGVVTDASGECQKARRLLGLKYPNIVVLDCYGHQVPLSCDRGIIN